MEHVHEDILELKKEIESIKNILQDDLELAEDIQQEIKQSRKRPKKEFISHEDMKKEFG